MNNQFHNAFGNSMNSPNGMGGVGTYAGMNPVNEPDLVSMKSGTLSWLWVNWYRSKTGATLPEAVQAGVGRMLELHQQMAGFFREYTVNRVETLSKFPDYAPRPGLPFDYDFYRHHLGREERYVPACSEPSPFYPEPKTPEGWKHDPRKPSPWQEWYMAKEGVELEAALQANEALCTRLNEQVRITPESIHHAPPPALPSGTLSLIWLLWMADCNEGASLPHLHNLGHDSIGLRSNQHRMFGNGPQPSFGI